MVNLASILKTANSYFNKIITKTSLMENLNVKGKIGTQAKILAQKSAETAMRDYAIMAPGLDKIMNNHSGEVEKIADQLVHEIMQHLLEKLDNEIDGEIDGEIDAEIDAEIIV